MEGSNLNLSFVSSLQKFKLGIANTVIGQDNSSLHSMNTSDLLDLFQVSGSQHQWSKVGVDHGVRACVHACLRLCLRVSEVVVDLQESRKSKGADGGGGEGGGGLKKVMENLPELWDDKQYADEYDLSGFMKSLTALEK